MGHFNIQRRRFLKLLTPVIIGGLSTKVFASAFFGILRDGRKLPGRTYSRLTDGRLVKAIPTTGELLPVIGMGTWRTFNVGDNPRLLKSRTQVLRAFYENGGGMIDSSPMYGSAEAVLGHTMGRLNDRQKVFAATKIWTPSTQHGISQIKDSKKLWNISRFDLFQVHNLVNWEEHLKTLLKYKAEGQIRYIGITTSHGRRHGELADIMRKHPIDFVQLTYNIFDREVEQELLPVAADKGIAVIANRPFQGGHLMRRFENSDLPAWADEVDCQNWAQFLLKYVTSHPAITCAIPATSKVDHMQENMGALHGAMPDDKQRKEMAIYISKLT